MSKSEVERRYFACDHIAVEKRDEHAGKIVGHAAVFNSLSEPLWGFREKIAPGAFAATIQSDDVRALFNHDSNFILGRNRSGTLKLSEDERGLLVEITPPDTQFARDLMISIERGDINQMSFGFLVKKESWENVDEANAIRTLQEVKLFDVSPVVFPAYTQTDVSVRGDYEPAIRSLIEWRQSQIPWRRNLAARRLQILEQELKL